MTSTNQQTGSCLCGQVAYSIAKSPFNFYLCHCTNCHKLTGATYQANSMYPCDAHTVTKGADELSIYHCDKNGSGVITHRHFCKNCGSPLFITVDAKPHVIIVMAGGLDGPDEFKPVVECFVKDRRPWVKGVEGSTEFEAMRTLP